MIRTTLRRVAAPGIAAVLTSAVVAAIALAGQSGPQAATAGPPQPTGQAAGQLTIGSGAAVPVLSYSFGASNPTSVGSGSGGGAGKVTFTELTVVKSVDSGTPDLFLNVAGGRHLPRVTFTAQWGVGSAAAKIVYDLEDVVVTQVANAGAGGAPSESLSFAFGKVRWTYTDPNGTTTGGWDVAENKRL